MVEDLFLYLRASVQQRESEFFFFSEHGILLTDGFLGAKHSHRSFLHPYIHLYNGFHIFSNCLLSIFCLSKHSLTNVMSDGA